MKRKWTEITLDDYVAKHAKSQKTDFATRGGK